jgi:hypothetical protein
MASPIGITLKPAGSSAMQTYWFQGSLNKQKLSVPIANVSGLVLGNAPAANVFLAGRQVNVLAQGLTQGNVTRLDQKSIQLLQKN